MKCEIWGDEASTCKEMLKKGSSFYGMGTMISNKVRYYYYYLIYILYIHLLVIDTCSTKCLFLRYLTLLQWIDQIDGEERRQTIVRILKVLTADEVQRLAAVLDEVI